MAIVRDVDPNKMLMDKDGNIKEFVQYHQVKEEEFFQLYAQHWYNAIKGIKGTVELKVFSACLLNARKHDTLGIIVTIDSVLSDCIKSLLGHEICPQNLSKTFRSLCESQLLFKTTKRGLYVINPKIAFVGRTNDRCQLVYEYTKYGIIQNEK